MTDGIQSLAVVDRLFPQILTGEKTSTIRWQERRIVQGSMRFYCEGNQSQTIDVDVFRCTDMPLSEAASFVGKADEWPDEIMLDAMREHYPDIRLARIVQVVEFWPPTVK